MNRKVVIVEDDKEICKLLSEIISKNGYEVEVANDGDIASRILKKQDYILVLMDLMLPYKSGEQLIKELRTYSQAPVIVLSAKSMIETRLEVLRLGADDYILKPFDIDEVLVRIEVVLRRAGSQKDDTEYLECNGLIMNLIENSVSYKNERIQLTAKEMMILRLFMENPKKTFTKANLYESVWNDDYFYEDNTINVHVSNLRSKLKKASGRDFIETVWGIGYKLREE